MRLSLIILASTATLAAAQVPTHTWQVETAQRPAPYALELIRGESITLAPQYVNNGVALSLQAATNAVLRYRTADMPVDGYYALSGTTSSGTATFAWGATNCAAATNYTYTIAIIGAGINLRSYGTIKLIGSVGGTSATLPTNETFDTSAYSYIGRFPASVIPTTESTLPTGSIVATNQGVAGQSFFFQGGSPAGVSTGYFATASGSGDMLISVYDSGGSKQVAYTNDPRIVLSVTSGVFVAGTGITNVNGVLHIGSNGVVGATGPQGPQGPQGPAGTNGATGATGPQGPAGTNGATGATGPQGPAGTNGATGATGPQGPAGTNGATGATGPQGPAGTNGTNGANGANGANGLNAYVSVTNVVTLAAGASAWASNNIVGTTNYLTLGIPQGATGPQGPAGTNGATGATGPQGPAGTNGATGATGATGPQGPAGTDGATGATGPQGPAGTNATGGVDAPTATNIVQGMLARFSTTNSIAVTNSTTFSLGLPSSSVCLDDVRVYAITPGVYSKRYSLRFFRSADFRRTYLAYTFTNGLIYATTTTVAQAVGAITNVVPDASGIVWPIDMYWQHAGGTTNDYVSFTNASPTVLWGCCTNTIAMPVGSLISHVEQLGSFNFWGGPTLYGDIIPTTGWTGTVQIVIDGARK